MPVCATALPALPTKNTNAASQLPSTGRLSKRCKSEATGEVPAAPRKKESSLKSGRLQAFSRSARRGPTVCECSCCFMIQRKKQVE